MPRFTIAGWLAFIGVIALGMTGAVEYMSGLIKIAWFLAFATSVLAVVHLRGRERAFWLGPLLVFTCRSLPTTFPFAFFSTGTGLGTYVAQLALKKTWTTIEHYNAVLASVDFLSTLFLAFATGLISMRLYLARQKSGED